MDPDPAATPRRPALRLLAACAASSTLLVGSAWLGALVHDSPINVVIFLLCVLVGTASGHVGVQSVFRLGRSMRRGYDPAAPSGVTPSLLWESVKTLWGFGMFCVKTLLGFALWAVFFTLYGRI